MSEGKLKKPGRAESQHDAGFDEKAAKAAVATIPGLSTDEAEAAFNRLSWLARHYRAPDYPKAKTEERLVKITDQIRRLQNAVGALCREWPDTACAPPEIWQLGETAGQSLPKLKIAADNALGVIGALPTKKGRGTVGQMLDASKEAIVIQGIVELWLLCTFEIPEQVTGPGREFVCDAYIAITGDRDEKNVENLLKVARKKMQSRKDIVLTDIKWLWKYAHNELRTAMLLDEGQLTRKDIQWSQAVIWRRFLVTAVRRHPKPADERDARYWMIFYFSPHRVRKGGQVD